MSTYQREQFPIPTPGRLRRELRLRRPPWWMIALLILVVAGTWVPLAMIYRARNTPFSRLPRVHLVQDMDRQPRRGPQSAHEWFLDGRAMRLPVEGTIARGDLRHNEHLYNGYFSAVDPANGSELYEFATTLPPEIPLTPALLERGRERFTIYCALCHGDGGLGDGPIHRRAIELKEPKWVPATNLMTEDIRSRSDGQLFQAIRDGVRNMPAYGAQIDAHDRWAIVAWLRDLQARSPVAPEEKKQ